MTNYPRKTQMQTDQLTYRIIRRMVAIVRIAVVHVILVLVTLAIIHFVPLLRVMGTVLFAAAAGTRHVNGHRWRQTFPSIRRHRPVAAVVAVGTAGGQFFQMPVQCGRRDELVQCGVSGWRHIARTATAAVLQNANDLRIRFVRTRFGRVRFFVHGNLRKSIDTLKLAIWFN